MLLNLRDAHALILDNAHEIVQAGLAGYREIHTVLMRGILPAEQLGATRATRLFAGSLRAGQRAAAIMSLIQSARLNGRDPYAYLKDVFLRLPTQPRSRIDELLPHRWQQS